MSTDANDLLEVAQAWEESAKFCDQNGEFELAERDRRLAAAMVTAAKILERSE